MSEPTTEIDEPCWCPAGYVLHAPGTSCPVRAAWLDVEDSE